VPRALPGYLLAGFVTLALAGCTGMGGGAQAPATSREVCDSYIVLDMCVRDFTGDGTVDMIYFSDTHEIFMYQDDRRELVAAVMPLHRCAVPLNPGMQETTNRILHRDNLSLAEELDITRHLISSYVAAKPEIDACNARFEQGGPQLALQDDSFMDDFDWDDE